MHFKELHTFTFTGTSRLLHLDCNVVVRQNSQGNRGRVWMPYYRVLSGAGSREGAGTARWQRQRLMKALHPAVEKAPTHDTTHNCSLSRTGSHSWSSLLHGYLNSQQLPPLHFGLKMCLTTHVCAFSTRRNINIYINAACARAGLTTQRARCRSCCRWPRNGKNFLFTSLPHFNY